MSIRSASTPERRPTTPPKLDRTRDSAIGRKLVVLWALIALPFLLTGATGGPDGHLLPEGYVGPFPHGLMPHAVFHPVYILIAMGAILILLRLRSATDSRAVRRLARALVVAQAAVIVGMVGEEIAVLQHGGLSAGRALFEEPLHVLSASVLTIPGLLVSQILLIVMTIAAALAMRAEQRLAAAGHI